MNAAFAAEKAGQIAAAEAAAARFAQRIEDGELAPIGGGRYRVMRGWDAGEVVTATRDERGRIAQVVAEHGLDTTTGRVALYSAAPTWHHLGAVVPGGITDIDDVLELGGIAFEVVKRPALFTFGEETGEGAGEPREVPGGFVTVRTDTGAPLGLVGKLYHPIQQRLLFRFAQDLVAERAVVWESAGAVREGQGVFVSLRIPESIIVDPGGLDDRVDLFLVLRNSHDGRSQAMAVVTPWRPVCGNTERFAVRDAVYRWGIRHTPSALDRIEQARTSLGLTRRYAEQFEAEETALARTELAIDAFQRVVADVWPLEADAGDRSRRYAAKRRERLTAMFEAESERVGRTAYAAERAVTDYLDHVAPRRPPRSMSQEIARATALIEGADDEVKTSAHARLMRLRER